MINKFKTLNPYSRIIPIDRNFENTVRIQSNVCQSIEGRTRRLNFKRVYLSTKKLSEKIGINSQILGFSVEEKSKPKMLW